MMKMEADEKDLLESADRRPAAQVRITSADGCNKRAARERDRR